MKEVIDVQLELAKVKRERDMWQTKYETTKETLQILNGKDSNV